MYVDPSDGISVVDLSGKEQAYAPGYTYSIGANYRCANGLFLGGSIEGKDAYLFNVLNDQRLDSCNLVRLHAGYEISGWSCTVWIKNAFNEIYDVRGFYFANEPPYYDTPKKWVSQGAPRQFGFSVSRSF